MLSTKLLSATCWQAQCRTGSLEGHSVLPPKLRLFALSLLSLHCRSVTKVGHKLSIEVPMLGVGETDTMSRVLFVANYFFIARAL